MRSCILLAAILIGMSINPTLEMSDSNTTFVAWFVSIAMIMDIVEFIFTLSKKDK